MKRSVIAASALLLSGCLFNDDNAREITEGVASPVAPGPTEPAPNPSPAGAKTAYCDSFTGASKVSSTFTNGCLDCGISNEKNVADDAARSFAALTVNDAPSTQGGAVRATAQSGTAFPAGRKAGAFITVPRQPSGTQVQAGASNALSIRTFLGGVQQESASLAGAPRLDVEVVSSDPELPQNYYSFTTTKTFDAVELFISNSQTTVGSDGSMTKTPPYKVYELCSDGGIK